MEAQSLHPGCSSFLQRQTQAVLTMSLGRQIDSRLGLLCPCSCEELGTVGSGYSFLALALELNDLNVETCGLVHVCSSVPHLGVSESERKRNPCDG